MWWQVVDSDGNTPLHLACSSNHKNSLKIAEMLLSKASRWDTSYANLLACIVRARLVHLITLKACHRQHDIDLAFMPGYCSLYHFLPPVSCPLSPAFCPLSPFPFPFSPFPLFLFLFLFPFPLSPVLCPLSPVPSSPALPLARVVSQPPW